MREKVREREYFDGRRVFRVHGNWRVACFLRFDIDFLGIGINVHLSEGELLGLAARRK